MLKAKTFHFSDKTITSRNDSHTNRILKLYSAFKNILTIYVGSDENY